MLIYAYGRDLDRFPQLRDSMFRDRALQFRERLGWDVSVDADGFERDQYDDLDPLYVMWKRPNGMHGGSMRMLPTTGRTMIAEHFQDIADISGIVSPCIWEVTRFCLAPGSEPRVAGALVLGAGEVQQGFGLVGVLGVFDERMVRIYRRLGASPQVLGTAGEGRTKISVGLWDYDEGLRPRIQALSEITELRSARWFERSFGREPAEMRKELTS